MQTNYPLMRRKTAKSFVPRAEAGRVPEAWFPLMVVSAVLNGFLSAIAAFVILPDKATGVLCTFITLTSINYWRRPEPGWRYLLDVSAILANIIWHYTLAFRNACAALCALYIAPHWMFMCVSLLAFNYLPPTLETGWTNKDWSAALWICMHISIYVMNIFLYKEVGGDKLICNH